MNILRAKARNYDIYRQYVEGDENFREGRVPELGTVAVYEDGRKYVFGSTSVGVTAGQLVSTRADFNTSPVGDYLAGLNEVLLNGATTESDEWAGNTLQVTGRPETYVVQSSRPEGGNTRVVLTDVLQGPISDGDDSSMAPFRPANVVVGTASSDPVGVALGDISGATQTTYAWFQYYGLALVDCSVAQGLTVTVGAAGEAIAADGTTALVGVVKGTDVIGGKRNIYLNIAGF